MKRFIVFSGEAYYPLGGTNDMDKSFDTFDEAFTYASRLHTCAFNWAHILDTKEGEVTEI